jgi:hypothetical protein
MGLKEENLRLKLALLDMVRQFYECILTPKSAEKYNVKNYNVDEDYYFHMFQSAGEHAWRILGIKNNIISGQELYRIEDILRDELLQCKKENNEV